MESLVRVHRMLLIEELEPRVAPATLYVDTDAGSGGNGQSWATAYDDLQSALLDLSLQAGDEIWVAKGTYEPTSGADRTASFQMVSSVGIYGGFSGSETLRSQRDWRVNQTILSGDIGVAGNITDNSYHVVIGAGAGATIDGFTITGGNATGPSGGLYHLGGGMFNNGVSPTVMNVVFSQNRATYGGGMCNYTASPTVTNTVFSENTSPICGGGMFNYSAASPTLTNVIFAENDAKSWGGGIFNSKQSSPTLMNATFSGNIAGRGGGIANQFTSSPTLTNCIMWGDTGKLSGAEIEDASGSSTTVTYSDIQGGWAGTGNINAFPYFGIMSDPDGPDNIFATIDDGLRLHGGGPAYNTGTNTGAPSDDILGASRPLNGITDMGAYEIRILHVDWQATGLGDGTTWANSYTTVSAALTAAAPGDELWVADGTYYPTAGTSRTASFTLKANTGVYGGFNGTENARDARDWRTNQTILSGDIGTLGVATDNSYHVVTGANLAILDGFTVTRGYANGGGLNNFGAGMYNSGASPTVSNCVFSNHYASYGAGMMNNTSSSPTITNCVFADNFVLILGAGMMNNTSSSPTLTNSVFYNNEANSWGGGMVNAASSAPTLMNCTFGKNVAGGGGAIANLTSSSATLTNCILWGDSQKGSGGPEIANNGGGTVTVTYSDVQGGWTGTGNISSDPLFNNILDGNGADNIYGTVDDGLRHGGGGPATDSATSVGAPTTDIVGGQRPKGGGFDMGAYETRLIYVDRDAPGTPNGTSWGSAFKTLTAALAVATPGDEIWVADGTYYATTGADRSASFTLVSYVEIYGGFKGTETLRTQRNYQTNVTILSGDIGTLGLNTDNSYHVVTGANGARLDGLTITAGYANGGGINSRGAGMYNSGASPTVANCTFYANTAADAGGGMMNYSASSLTVTDSIFTGNTAAHGGAMVNEASSSATVTKTIFSQNSSSMNGGAVVNHSSSPTFVNCIFSQNQLTGVVPTSGGGAMSNISGASVTITNSTFSQNTSAGNGGALYFGSSTGTIKNCILWGDTAAGSGNEIYNYLSTPTVTYSDIQGGYAGTGNINANPQFEDSSDPDGPDNVWRTTDDGLRQRGGRLPQSGSPVVNKGTNTGAPSTDIIGISRSKGNTADMGAYERGLLFVDRDAGGLNNGTSWTNAYTTLTAALSAATAADEIWVADGTYRPTSGADRTVTFQLKADVAVYGGFKATENIRSARSWTTNRAILSGDIGTGGDATDNSYHVVTGANDAVLSGFTVTGGNANGSSALWQHVGGGMYNNGVSPRLTDVVFSGNAATYGGGMYNYNSSSPRITNVVFSQNTARICGGGMQNQLSSSPTLTNVIFVGNTARSWGGGIANFVGSNPALMNCTFTGNIAVGGGAIANLNSSFATLVNCILWGDLATGTGNEIDNDATSSSTVTYSDVQGGYTGTGNINQDPLFYGTSNPAGADGIFATADDGLRLLLGSPVINAGTAVGAPLYDILYITRLPGIDMGAFEYVP